jgi:hypothetical protein
MKCYRDSSFHKSTMNFLLLFSLKTGYVQKFYQEDLASDRIFARILGLPLFMMWRAGTLFSHLMASFLAVHGFDAIQVSPR